MTENSGSSVDWLPNWYCTRLHAFVDDAQLSLCRTVLHGLKDARSEWQRRRMEQGVPKCTLCVRGTEAYAGPTFP